MKQWAIPVSWEVAGVVIIPANTLEEAIHAAKHDDSIGLPSGEYVDGSFDVTVDDDDEFSDVADFFDDMLSDEADYDVNTNK